VVLDTIFSFCITRCNNLHMETLAEMLQVSKRFDFFIASLVSPWSPFPKSLLGYHLPRSRLPVSATAFVHFGVWLRTHKCQR